MVKILFTIGQDGNFMAVNQAQLISITRWICLLLFVWLFTGCSDSEWNNPYPASESRQEILYSSFSERPKHLDPVRAYSSNEYEFIAQIYEPLLQYHFLKRPYQLVPLAAASVPVARYYDAKGNLLPEEIAARSISASTISPLKRRCVTSPILRWHVIATGSISITRWANFRSQH